MKNIKLSFIAVITLFSFIGANAQQSENDKALLWSENVANFVSIVQQKVANFDGKATLQGLKDTCGEVKKATLQRFEELSAKVCNNFRQQAPTQEVTTAIQEPAQAAEPIKDAHAAAQEANSAHEVAVNTESGLFAYVYDNSLTIAGVAVVLAAAGYYAYETYCPYAQKAKKNSKK